MQCEVSLSTRTLASELKGEIIMMDLAHCCGQWKTTVLSLQDTVFFVVRLKVLVHTTGVGHLLAIGLWQKLGIVHPLLLVEEDVGRVCINLLGAQFLEVQRERYRVSV